jgi:hypothetical protein
MQLMTEFTGVSPVSPSECQYVISNLAKPASFNSVSNSLFDELCYRLILYTLRHWYNCEISVTVSCVWFAPDEGLLLLLNTRLYGLRGFERGDGADIKILFATGSYKAMRLASGSETCVHDTKCSIKLISLRQCKYLLSTIANCRRRTK